MEFKYMLSAIPGNEQQLFSNIISKEKLMKIAVNSRQLLTTTKEIRVA